MVKAPTRRRPTQAGPLSPEIGVSGLHSLGGMVREEFLPALRGRLAAKTYVEMSSNDPTIGALLFAIEMLARQVEWSVEPDDDTPESEEAAEFVEGCFDDMSSSFGEWLAEVLSFGTFGWAYHEIVYKLRVGPNEASPQRRSRFDDGRIGWRKLQLRAQETLHRWEFDPDGGVRGMWQLPPLGGAAVLIPIERAVLYRTTSRKNNPEGRSLLRTAYRPWYFKKRLETIEAVGLERELTGLPMIKIPAALMDPNAAADEKTSFEQFKNIGRNVRADEQACVIIPSDVDPDTKMPLYDFSLVSTAGQRTLDPNSAIGRYERQIVTSVLADFLLLGHEKVGSFALSEDKTSIFATALGTLLDVVSETTSRHAIPRLLLLNGMAGRAKLVHGEVSRKDVAKLFEALSKGTLAGFNFSDLEDFFREQQGWPVRPLEADGADEIEDDDEEGRPPGPPANDDEEDDDDDQRQG